MLQRGIGDNVYVRVYAVDEESLAATTRNSLEMKEEWKEKLDSSEQDA